MKNKISLTISSLALIISFQSMAQDQGEINDPILIKSPSLKTIFKNSISGYNFAFDDLKIERTSDKITFNGDNIKRDLDGYAFNIKYDLSLTDRGYYKVKNGEVNDVYGFSKFEFEIDKEKISGNDDFISVFEKASYVSFSSNSSKLNSSIISLMNLDGLVKNDKVYESLSFEKNGEMLNIKSASISVGDVLSVQLVGNYDLNKDVFLDGFLTYLISDNVKNSLNKNGVNVLKNQAIIDLSGFGYDEIINKIM